MSILVHRTGVCRRDTLCRRAEPTSAPFAARIRRITSTELNTPIGRNIPELTGLPLPIGISAANTHDSQALEHLVSGIPPIRSRRGPRRRRPAKLHGDKGYDYDHLRR